MKIFNINQIRELDLFTIEREPILSIDLMERASTTIFDWLTIKYTYKNIEFIIFCGKGNNGGDGLAVARMLIENGYNCDVYYLDSHAYSEDFTVNFGKLSKINPPIKITSASDFPTFKENRVIIDAIFGSGLKGKPKGIGKDLINYLNALPNKVVSIDCPSGFLADQPTNGVCIFANHTLTFESIKLGFLFPENHKFVGQISILPIALNKSSKAALNTSFYYVDNQYIKSIKRNRLFYAHKGNFGHVLLINGSYGKLGAAILAARACLRSGAGLVTVHVPKIGYHIIQVSVPEAMVVTDSDECIFTRNNDIKKYDVLGIGCGLGTHNLSRDGLIDVLKACNRPIVLDADALNLIAQNPEFLEHIPPQSILTPHPKEFERMFGKSENSFDRNILQSKQSKKYGIYILLKGAHTCITTPDGDSFFNSTGNPGMATAGSGDVLTGLLAGLLAQGYSSKNAAILGAYLHGFAGDIAADKMSQEALIASDIIDHIGSAIKRIYS